MAILLHHVRMVFFSPLFLYRSVASFPLISTSSPKEKHEEYFTASLKRCCPAQESTDRHQKLVSINALCCVAMLHRIFWWVRMCRVATSRYRASNKLSFMGSRDGWVWDVFTYFCCIVCMCFSRYMHTLTAVFFQGKTWEPHLCFMQAVSSILIRYTWEYKTEPVVQSLN